MISIIHSAGIYGVQVEPTTIEVEVSNRGLPSISIIGLPASEAKNCRERLRAVLRSLGKQIRAKKIVIRISPPPIAHFSSLDLPIVVGILAGYEHIPQPKSTDFFFGALSLSGNIPTTPGVFAVLSSASKTFTRLFFPQKNVQAYFSLIEQEKLFPVSTVQECMEVLQHNKQRSFSIPSTSPKNMTIDPLFHTLSPSLQRALTICAAGQHHTILYGAPGSGKSLAGTVLHSMTPPLATKELLEVAPISSIASPSSSCLNRPFQHIQSERSIISLFGGSKTQILGKITRAHKGMLLIEDLFGYSKQAIFQLTQLLDAKTYATVVAEKPVTLPANFTFVATTNPCPCGNLYNDQKKCSCSPGAIQQYKRSMPAALLDRIDLHVHVETESYQPPTHQANTKAIVYQMLRAQKRQMKRYINSSISFNGSLTSETIAKFCTIPSQSEAFLMQAADHFKFSHRRYGLVIRVAQTIADLEEKEQCDILPHHIAEALTYIQTENV